MATQQSSTTLWSLLQESFLRNRDKECIGRYSAIRNEYMWKSYREVMELADRLATALALRNVNAGDRIVICADGTIRWVVCELCNLRQGFISVPVHPDSPQAVLEEIVKKVRPVAILVEARLVSHMLDVVMAAGLIGVTKMFIIPTGNPSPLETQAALNVGINFYPFTPFLESTKGKDKAIALPPRPKDEAFILFDQQEDGTLRGSTITQEAAAFAIGDTSTLLFTKLRQLTTPQGKGDKPSPPQTYLSLLPLSDPLERFMALSVLLHGQRLCFPSEPEHPLATLINDIDVWKPSILCGTPLVWKVLQRKAENMISQSLKKSGGKREKKGFWSALKKKSTSSKDEKGAKDPACPMSLLGKSDIVDIKKKLCGSVSAIISGSSPLAYGVEEWLSTMFDLQPGSIKQLFTLPEISGIALWSVDNQTNSGPEMTGEPPWRVEIRLTDYPELDLTSAYYPPMGQMWVKAPSLCEGYWDDKAATQASLDDGWVCTGYLGRLNDGGGYSILGHRDYCLKTSSGQYIDPVLLESIYGQLAIVDQIWIHASPSQPSVLAVIVPNKSELERALAHIREEEAAAAKDKKKDKSSIPLPESDELTSDEFKLVCNSPSVRADIIGQMKEVAKRCKRTDQEVPAGVLFASSAFTVENGLLLVPTMMPNRAGLRQLYEVELNKVFEAIAAGKSDYESLSAIRSGSTPLSPGFGTSGSPAMGLLQNNRSLSAGQLLPTTKRPSGPILMAPHLQQQRERKNTPSPGTSPATMGMSPQMQRALGTAAAIGGAAAAAARSTTPPPLMLKSGSAPTSPNMLFMPGLSNAVPGLWLGQVGGPPGQPVGGGEMSPISPKSPAGGVISPKTPYAFPMYAQPPPAGFQIPGPALQEPDVPCVPQSWMADEDDL